MKRLLCASRFRAALTATAAAAMVAGGAYGQCDPTPLGSLGTPFAQGVAVSGTTAYVTDGAAGLLVIDVANPAAPALLGVLDTPGFAEDVAVSGTTVYVADGDPGLLVIDVADPTAPALLATLNTHVAVGVVVSGTTVYVADRQAGLQVIDVANPAVPVILGTLDTSNAHDVAVSGTIVYVADTSDGLLVIDVADPMMPMLIDILDTGNARGVVVSGTTAYVADGQAGLRVIDVANSADPVLLGTLDTAGFAEAVAVSGTTVYVAGGSSGLQVIDVADPMNPVLLSTLFTGGFAHDVKVSGTTAYVADLGGGLRVIDVLCAACCLPGDECVREPVDVCSGLGGVFQGNVSCDQVLCSERSHPGWNFVDNGITLTANEPTYWSALTGQPKGVSPFTVLDPGSPPGRPAMDGTPDRVLRGYVIAWAVDQFGEEIRWNHLKGEGTIVNYRDASSWEYSTWNHAAVANVDHGAPLPEPGVLRLDGAEYSLSFDELLLNFQAANSGGFSASPAHGFLVESDTDLTLFPPGADLRQNTDGPVTTKASFDIWNENETKFSGTHRCITCWDQTLLSRYDTPNHFIYAFLQTDHGKARIDGHAAGVCNVLDDPSTPEDESVTSVLSPLLGVYARHLEINGVSTASSGSNLVGMGTDDTAVIRYDVSGGGGGPPEGQMPTDPAKLIDWFVRIAESRAELPRIDDASRTEHIDMAELSGPTQDRVSGTEKGSLLFFSKVELRWGGPPEFPLIQDTFLSITNDFPEDVRVQMYFVNGDAPIAGVP